MSATAIEPRQTAASSSRVSMMPRFDLQAVDPNAPVFVATMTTFGTFIGGALGGTYSFSNGMNPVPDALLTGRRWLALSIAFFSLREYVVSPLLLSNRISAAHNARYEEMSDRRRGKLREEPDRRYIIADRLADSTLAAGLGFGGFTWYQRGLRAVPRAAITAAVAAATLQFGANSLKYLLTRNRSSAKEDSEAATSKGPTTGQQIISGLNNPLETLDVPEGTTLSNRILDAMSTVLPMHKIENTEYMRKLREQRADIEAKLKAIEAEENSIYEAAMATPPQKTS